MKKKREYYSRPYVGKLTQEYKVPEKASALNRVLLSQGRPGLTMTEKGPLEMQVFRSVQPPTSAQYHHFACITGPFHTMRAAVFMATHPECKTIAEAERLSSKKGTT